jgi:serine/threonine protein kinase
MTDGIGTHLYRAPEQLLGSTASGTPVDIWAVGCFLDYSKTKNVSTDEKGVHRPFTFSMERHDFVSKMASNHLKTDGWFLNRTVVQIFIPRSSKGGSLRTIPAPLC